MITPSHTLSPEWQNENALRAYPLTDDAKAATTIPSWLIADLRVTCPSTLGKVFVSSVYVSETLVSVGISASDGQNPPVGLLTKTVTRDELEPWRSYSMDRLAAPASGTIAFGEIPVDATPLKATFLPAEALLVESAVVRTPAPAVTEIVDAVHGASASGVIDISGNSEFRTYLDPDPTHPNTVVIALSDLYRDLTTSVCDATPSFSACGQTPVKTINGVTPTDGGVIYLRFR